jgi:sterol desaturase/sphingolipid hydroxylase (fatty acid hydroxylase superfamily)
VQKLLHFVQSHGYFDATVLWRQFYDEAVPFNYFRWYLVLLYVAGCAAFFLATRKERGVSLSAFGSFLLPADVRRAKSFRIDLWWALVTLFKIPGIITGAAVTLLSFAAISSAIAALHIGLLGPVIANLPGALRVTIIFLVALLSAEFGHYWAHRLSHRSLFLWQFHKVHHYSEQINVLTDARTHPIDKLLPLIFTSVCMAIGVSLVAPPIGNSFDAYATFAKNYWWLWPISTFPFTVGYFSHTPQVPISLGWGDYVFLTPALHVVHHARDRRLHDGNYGGSLSVWDWVFGTARRHDLREPLPLGIEEFGDDHYRHIGQLFYEPFVDATRVARDRLARLAARWRTA